MNIWERILQIDRRYIFLLIGISGAIPIIMSFSLPTFVTPEVKGVYNAIDALPEGAMVLVSFDYEPSAMPEMDPMAKAILRHIFGRGLKVVGVTLIPYGTGIGEELFVAMEREFNLKQGVDYDFLGYKPGYQAVVLGLGQDLKGSFPKDFYEKDTRTVPILKDINSLRDFDYMMWLHDDAYGGYSWIIYGRQNYGIDIGSGCTAILATGMYPFLQADQVTGIVGGLKGAAEYEKLMGYIGPGRLGMVAQSSIHVMIVALILLGNIAFILSRRKPKKDSS